MLRQFQYKRTISSQLPNCCVNYCLFSLAKRRVVEIPMKKTLRYFLIFISVSSLIAVKGHDACNNNDFNHCPCAPIVFENPCHPCHHPQHSCCKLPITQVPLIIKNKHSLEGKIVLVTGGSRGIGRATCEAFVKAGCIVIGTSRHPDQVPNPPIGAELFQLDVRSDQSVAACIQKIIGKYGRIDILVNNAGIGQVGRLITTKPDDWINLFQTNLLGVHRVTIAAYPFMIRPETRIITLGSIAGEYGGKYSAVYALGKRALQVWNDIFEVEELSINAPKFTLIEPNIVHTTFPSSPDVVNTEPNNPFIKELIIEAQMNANKFGMDPARVGQAIVDIASMDNPLLRYYIADPRVLFNCNNTKDLLIIAYTKKPGTLYEKGYL